MCAAAIVDACRRARAGKGGPDRLLERFGEKVAFIWQIAELLRGDYKAFEYGKVILPFVVLRRLDCVLEPTKERVLAEAAKTKLKNPELLLQKAAGQAFYNTSKLDFKKLLADPERIARNMNAYIRAFSAGAQDILDNFEFGDQIARLDKAGLLYKIVGSFADLDLHPDSVPNVEMGYIFEELIRRFSEQSNETAGEHFTPREVIRLMVNLLFAADREFLTKPGAVRTLYDPAAGTGGMLSVAEDYLRSLNPKARLVVFGQELNPESYAICKSDMMLKGQDPSHIHRGNSFTEDGEAATKFDYMLSNPPFGVDWKKVQEKIEKEHKEKGFDGRFGAGLPRINDGSFLFLQHMISKMKAPADGGSRIAIVFNSSPLFTGAAGSGESEIRRWIVQNDWLDAIVALPAELFYNTGIATYVWLLSNRKATRRQGKVQLIDGRDLHEPMRKSLGNKRRALSHEHIQTITECYTTLVENERSRFVRNDAFGYRRVAVRLTKAPANGHRVHEPDAGRTEFAYEDVPLGEDVERYVDREVRPYAPKASVDVSRTKLGYEIPFTRFFYSSQRTTDLAELDTEIRELEARISAVLSDVARARRAAASGPRKSSRIPWLASIPINWREARLKYVARLGTGHTPSRQHPEWWKDCTIPWITTADVHKFRDDRLERLDTTENLISEAGLANSAAVLHPKDTVVLSRTASVGFSVIMGREMATSQDFATWSCSSELLPEFLLQCLRAMRADLLGRLAQGSTHKTIYMPDIESLMIPLPTLAVQRSIVDTIRQLVAPIDALAEALGEPLPRLSEYRRALVQAAVAGEVELVRA